MGGCYCSFKLKLSLSQAVVFLRYVSHHVTVGTRSKLNNPERTCWLPHTSSLPTKGKNPVLQPRWAKPLHVDRLFRAEPYSPTGTSKHDHSMDVPTKAEKPLLLSHTQPDCFYYFFKAGG